MGLHQMKVTIASLPLVQWVYRWTALGPSCTTVYMFAQRFSMLIFCTAYIQAALMKWINHCTLTQALNWGYQDTAHGLKFWKVARALLKPVCTVNTLEVWTAWNILAFVGSYPKVSAIWTNWLHHWEAKGSNVFASSWCSGIISSLDILCKRTHTSPIIVSSATIINYPEIDPESSPGYDQPCTYYEPRYKAMLWCGRKTAQSMHWLSSRESHGLLNSVN